jgi:hypothetical protein
VAVVVVAGAFLVRRLLQADRHPASYARMSSRIDVDGRAAPGVEVTLGAGPDGSTCAGKGRHLADPVD